MFIAHAIELCSSSILGNGKLNIEFDVAEGTEKYGCETRVNAKLVFIVQITQFVKWNSLVRARDCACIHRVARWHWHIDFSFDFSIFLFHFERFVIRFVSICAINDFQLHDVGSLPRPITSTSPHAMHAVWQNSHESDKTYRTASMWREKLFAALDSFVAIDCCRLSHNRRVSARRIQYVSNITFMQRNAN